MAVDPPYPSFPASDHGFTLPEVLADFARCAALDGAHVEVDAPTVEALRKELPRENRTAAQRAQYVAMLFAGPFRALNAALSQRGGDTAWSLFQTLAPDGTTRARWYRLSAAEARAFEAAGALSVAATTRAMLLRLPAVVTFYVLLWQAWKHQTTNLYAASAAALVVYLLLRWRLPLKPRVTHGP